MTFKNIPVKEELSYKQINEPWMLKKGRGGRAFIHEIFTSIQGEGLFAGEPTTFIRFQFCPFDCNWCDSKRTWAEPSGTDKSRTDASDIEITTKHICITGGEPMAQPKAVKKFVEIFKMAKVSGNGDRIGRKTYRDKHIISVETSGYLPVMNEQWMRKVDSWVVDIKPPGATNFVANVQTTPLFSTLAKLRLQDQVKFCVVDGKDLDFVVGTMHMYPTKAQVLISPVNPTKEIGGIESATIDLEWHQEVIKFCIEQGYRFSPQLHKFMSVQ